MASSASASSSRLKHSKDLFHQTRHLMVCATKLSISSGTTATACVFLHRFCRECSHQSSGSRNKSSSSSSSSSWSGVPDEYDAPLIIATCIYLAGKAAEE